ncbi:hypothetical protein [Halococcus hamelinensis]|uniref:Uncharacterized protein n=1 Tax=Halococcus hamelinensis 100A6 TaxID=1132509 RepID=M0M4Z9_9EURY|nr:hypothetical protein [Halococcus hamelinensis]EMA40776.1 hypothetical protein C447_03241 [Halococcus hamelinensis 100A6]
MGNGENGSPESGWSSKRRQIAYQETRAALGAQQAALTQIDNKAIENVRITTILLGVFVSAARLSDFTFEPVTRIIGGFALTASLGAGIFTYNETDPYLGLNQEYIDELIADEFARSDTWEKDLPEFLAGFVDENADDIEFNGASLTVAQASLFIGVVFVALSAVI